MMRHPFIFRLTPIALGCLLAPVSISISLADEAPAAPALPAAPANPAAPAAPAVPATPVPTVPPTVPVPAVVDLGALDEKSKRVVGSITEADDKIKASSSGANGSRAKTYECKVRKGQYVQLEVEQIQTDNSYYRPFLRVQPPGGRVLDARDNESFQMDNGASGVRVSFTATEDGVCRVQVAAVQGNGVGKFSLKAEAFQVVSLFEGDGELAATDPKDPKDGCYYDSYHLAVEAGQRLVISMKSTSGSGWAALGIHMPDGKTHLFQGPSGDPGKTSAVIKVTTGGDLWLVATSTSVIPRGTYKLTVLGSPRKEQTQ